MNKVNFLDNNFVLFRESEELFSPIGMIHYHYYSTESDITDFISNHENQLQVVVGKASTPFGASQFPQLKDYPDHIDSLNFLSAL
jgi:hypothetical protein